MALQEYRFDPSQQLVPALSDFKSRTAPANYAPSISVLRGQSLGRKTATGKIYPLNRAATDGTHIWCGFAQMSGTTDANGVFYPVFNGTAAGTNFYGLPQIPAVMWVTGVFNPDELITAAAGTAVAEVDSVTIGGTIVAGDVYTIIAGGIGIEASYVATTTTQASVVTGLNALWNGNPALAAIGTAAVGGSSNVSTFTAVTAGQPLSLTVGKNSAAGTISLAITTAAVAASAGEVDTFTYSTAPTIGDTFTLTATLPSAVTASVAYTATAGTVANVVSGLAAAWNNSPVATSGLAVASNTSSAVVLTGSFASQILNITATTSSVSTTISKAVTSPATGASLADITPGCPGARVVQPYGFWEVP